MPETPRRERFQIHLSTAIVLMFFAGGLLWANLQRWQSPSCPPYGRFYGCPFFVVDEHLRKFDYLMAALDVIVAAALLFAIWQFCEWITFYGKRESARRRAARKSA